MYFTPGTTLEIGCWMKGIERDLLNMSVDALKRAYIEVNSIKCDFAVETVCGGKSDTYGLDWVPEDVIKRVVGDYDANIVFITEETGKMYSGEQGFEPTQTVLISDPTDRSIKMKEFLQGLMEKEPVYGKKSVHDALTERVDHWEELYGNPSISGASASITAIRDRWILFNAMVNYVTGELFIADSLGTKKGRVLFYGKEDTESLEFPSEKGNAQKFMTFLQKEGYPENLQKCNLGLKEDDCVDPWTGGPLRILNLSSLDKQNVSFILSNGEKICEWIGWLSWVKYARDPVQSDEHALEAYRVFFESPRTKELVSVAPGPHYSIFSNEDGKTRVNLNRMLQLRDPSHYRETILVAPRHNMAAISRARALGKYQKELRL
jgi:hypothetical protein